MCDTLCVLGSGRTLLAKPSDRPPDEVQVVEAHGRRPGGGRLRTQYLELDDAGAHALVGSRPEWLWGLEHGVNEHGVAIGNEKVITVVDPWAAPPALLGMDLVRLGLERATTADEALDVMTALLEQHGQGGVGDLAINSPYWSAFLVADGNGAWVLETSGRTWAARRADGHAAISNRLSLRTDWTRASADVAPGSDVDGWRPPEAPTGYADVRLAVTVPWAGEVVDPSPRSTVALLRHHGTRPWGAPGDDPADVEPPPPFWYPDGTGISVCMHARGFQATTSSMVAELPAGGGGGADALAAGGAVRAWVALGSPCVSVYVPVFLPDAVPAELASPTEWQRFAVLRQRVEDDPPSVEKVRAVLGPVEADLWNEADSVSDDAGRRTRFVAGAWAAVAAPLRRLGC